MYNILKKAVLFLVLATFFVSAPAGAVDLANKFVLGFDAGFDLDPDLFATAVVAEYHVTSNVALGPYLNMGINDDTFLFATSGMAKYKANLNESAQLKPYGMMGIGFIIWNEKEYGDWDREVKFFFPVGGGFEYWVNEKVAFGSNMVFNITDEIFLSLFFGVRTNF